MGVATAVKDAAVAVGSIVSEHGDTITKVTNRAGTAVKVTELSVKAANASSFQKAVDGGLDAASLAVAATVGVIPIVNEFSVPIQAAIAGGKVVNHLVAGDSKGARSAAIEGLTMTGASLIPGGGLVAKVGKVALMGAGTVAANADKIGETTSNLVSGGETVQAKGGMPADLHDTPSTKLAAAKTTSQGKTA